MARFPSIDSEGAFEAPEVQNSIKELVTGSTDGITVDTSVGTRVYVGDTIIHGDTGWRDVGDLLINGWTGTAIQMKRENNMVTIAMSGGSLSVNGTDATSNQFIQLPVGFLPSGGNYVFIGWASTASGRTPVAVDKDFQTLSLGVRDRVIGQISYSVGKDWPTSLPGSPA